MHATSFEAVRRIVEIGLSMAILPALAAYPFAWEDGFAVWRLRETWVKRTLMLRVREQVIAPPLACSSSTS